MKIPYDKLDTILETSKELIKKKEKQRKKRMLFLINVSGFAAGICVFIFFSVEKELFTKGEKRMNRAHYLKTDIRRLIKITQYIWPLWVLQYPCGFPLKIMRLLREW